MKRIARVFYVIVASLLCIAFLAGAILASSVDVAVVDVTAPFGSVTLAPGETGTITINMTVTGKQDGTATFKVYKDWTLSGGVFTGTNPEMFMVPPRAAQDPATTFSCSGSVIVASGQGAGTFVLAVGAFDITNSNPTGAKLATGSSSNYQVTVAPPADTTPPVTSISLVGTVGNGDWYRSNVQVTLTAVDNEGGSGVKETKYRVNGGTWTTYSGPFTVSSEGINTVEYYSVDNANNFETTKSQEIKIDKTPPTITASAKKADNSPYTADTWTNQDVTVHFECADAGGSGLASCPSDVTYSTEGTYTASGTATDNAGNSASTSFGPIKIDKTPPTITINVPGSGATYYIGQVVNADWSATDGLSGIASANGTVPSGSPIDTSSVGTKSFTVNATDNAGNTSSRTVQYNVIYRFTGFFQPVDNPPVSNKVKAGSAVPVKFSLSGYYGLNIFAGQPTSGPIPCSGGTLSDVEEIVPAGGSSLSYDASADQYVYVWKTDRNWGGTCRQLTVTLNDGTVHIAYFTFFR